MQPIVSTSQGKVRGNTVDGVSAFLGIPYAAAPVGPALFAAPGPAPSWDGVRDALVLGPTAPKPGYPPPFDRLLADPDIPGDEFLNVNVWTPDPSATGLPVMVWIHGGAYRNGSNAITTYDGTAFARDGVVLVGVNYRLGAPGFAVLPDAPHNRGILDQLAALAWVRDNIAAFGGDPSRVTIFGESAGAMSVSTLLSLPAARGLFQRAIAQSGAGHTVATVADASRVTAELAARLGVEGTAAALHTVDVPTLIAAQQAVAFDVTANPDPARWGRSIVDGAMAYFPVVDGELITRRPVDAVAAGVGADVALLTGTTTEEYRFFLAPVGLIARADAELVRGVVAARGFDPAVVDLYAANRPDESMGDVLAAVITDWYFRVPAFRLAEAHTAAGGRTHLYEFAWRSSVPGLGSCHALEIPFVFDRLGAHSHPMTGPNPPQELADRMHAAWVAFATDGDPGWVPFDADRRPVRIFGGVDGTDETVVDDPRGDERAFWDGSV